LIEQSVTERSEEGKKYNQFLWGSMVFIILNLFPQVSYIESMATSAQTVWILNKMGFQVDTVTCNRNLRKKDKQRIADNLVRGMCTVWWCWQHLRASVLFAGRSMALYTSW